MKQLAIALGYFFLSVFCVFTSAHSFVELRLTLLIAALLALVAGIGYAASPLGAGLRAVYLWPGNLTRWLGKMIRLAQEPPNRVPATTDETLA